MSFNLYFYINLIILLIGIIAIAMFIYIKLHGKLYGLIKIKNKPVYQKQTVGGHKQGLKEKKLIKENQNFLREHGVPINKVRFVFQPCFEYDVDKNIINPVYQVMLPTDKNTGLFINDEPLIEIGKPLNVMAISVGSYKMDDNYEYLKSILKNSKRGIVIMIADETWTNIGTGEPEPYKFSVDDEVIRFANLDAAVEYYFHPVGVDIDENL